MEMNAQNLLSINWRSAANRVHIEEREVQGRCHTTEILYNGLFSAKAQNNHGERNAYYMEGSHAAIISDVDFEAAQKIRAGRRRSTGITNTVLRGALYCCCESPLRMRMSGAICVLGMYSSQP